MSTLEERIAHNKKLISELKERKQAATVSEVGFLIEGKYHNERDYLLRKAANVKQENDASHKLLSELDNQLVELAAKSKLLTQELVLASPAEETLGNFRRDVTLKNEQRAASQAEAKRKLQLLKHKVSEYENELQLINTKCTNMERKKHELLLQRDAISQKVYDWDNTSCINSALCLVHSAAAKHESHARDLRQTSASPDSLFELLREFKIQEISSLKKIKAHVQKSYDEERETSGYLRVAA
eukprot:TRINITY_DN27760_c0_g1_i1.p1 TRINITY_DN27760_c0_g1~~TRINITY_DN27760_c0_g1_i1.p1  ORF type:complete len:242 (+),score=55.45 TRINITY_DN27760_c0_g1_i1:66-791(+)